MCSLVCEVNIPDAHGQCSSGVCPFSSPSLLGHRLFTYRLTAVIILAAAIAMYRDTEERNSNAAERRPTTNRLSSSAPTLQNIMAHETNPTPVPAVKLAASMPATTCHPMHGPQARKLPQPPLRPLAVTAMPLPALDSSSGCPQ